MSVIAFNFTKIHGERKTGAADKLNIKNQTVLRNVTDTPVGSQKGLLFSFMHTIQYEPDYASVILEGEVVVLVPEKEVKETIAAWKKDKHLSPNLTEQVMNTVLNKVSIQALIMTRDLNLPAPIKLPRILMEEAKLEPKAEAKGKKK